MITNLVPSGVPPAPAFPVVGCRRSDQRGSLDPRSRPQLDGTAVERLAAGRHSQRLQRGDVLYREGEPAESLYLVVCGALKVLVRTSAGKPRLADLAGVGDVLGAASIEHARHAETVVAAADCCVVAVESVDELSRDMRRTVAASLARQLGRSRAYTDDIGLPTGARISRVLARLAARFGDEPARPDVHLPFSLTHDDLALLAGCARVTVTRILGELKEAGAVHGNRGDYSVIPQRLEQETDRYVYDFL